MNIAVSSFRPHSLKTLSSLKQKRTRLPKDKASTPHDKPKKLAVFDIDNTLMYYHYLNEHPHGKTNFEPINPVLDILKKKVADPHTLVVIQTNALESHAENAFKKLGIDSKSFFYRRTLSGEWSEQGRLDVKSDDKIDKNKAVIDCTVAISQPSVDKAFPKDKEIPADNKDMHYESKPSTVQLFDALSHLFDKGKFDPEALEKITVYGDTLNTDGDLAKNAPKDWQEGYGKSIKSKYLCIDPYQKTDETRFIDAQKSFANYKTKKTPVPVINPLSEL